MENVYPCIYDAGEGKRPGVMIPIPQYPLYSASLAEYNMAQVSSECRDKDPVWQKKKPGSGALYLKRM